MVDSTTTQRDLSYPPGVKRENLIAGLSEIEKDILILSLSGLVLVLMVIFFLLDGHIVHPHCLFFLVNYYYNLIVGTVIVS